jgi:predicted porin
MRETEMKKKLLVFGVLGAVAIPAAALAQGTNVTIYGTLNVDFERVEAKDTSTSGPGNSLVGAPPATAPELDPRNRVSSNASNIGFRGTEDLGNGLKAIFQLESLVNVDTGGGNLGGRNSHVGLSGGWGTLFYGQWDTPFRILSVRQDAWYATGIGAYNSMVGTPGFGVAGIPTLSGSPGSFGTAPSVAAGPAVGAAANASFDRRQGDSVQYWSPLWAGLAFRVGYSANEAKSADNAVPEINPYTWSAGVTYTNGPLYLAAGYEEHIDWFGLSSLTTRAGVGGTAAVSSSEDNGIKFGAGYSFGNTTINLIWERLEYENDSSSATVNVGTLAAPVIVARVEQFERDLVYLNLLHKIGNWTIRASYAHADDGDCELVGIGGCSTRDLGAAAWSIGTSYTFSKRTDAYALLTRVNNDNLARYSLGGAAGTSLSPAGAVGYENNGVALGIRHTF